MEKEKTTTDIKTGTLAFIGDAVYELFVRKMLVESGEHDPEKLHIEAVKYVRAESQAYAIKKLNVEGENVANSCRNSIRLNATLTSNAKVKADFVGGLDMAKEDTRMNLSVTGVKLTDFDAICRNYTSYPLEDGVLSLKTMMDVKRAHLNGTNHIEIDQPKVGMKDLSSDAPFKNIPLQLGFAMLTSAQGMIVLDVPVTGDVNNPQFSFRKIIGRALGKVFFGPLMGTGDKKNKSKVSEE